MEKIVLIVEHLINICGITGSAVPVVRHALLVLITILLAAGTGYICRKIIVPLVIKATKKTNTKWDDILLNRRALISASHIVPAVVVWLLLPWVFFQFHTVQMVLTRLTAIYITIMSVATLIVFIDSFKQFESEKRTATQQYLYTFCGLLKIVMIFIAVVVVVSILINKSPMVLFAGLGATSAILMLVFQDTITGLVAGVRLTSNDMLRKGDWITVGNTGVDGVVEEMTLTTVKVRNFDNTIMTISPKTLVDESFQNWKGMIESAGRKVVRRMYYDFNQVTIIDDDTRAALITKGYFKEKEIETNAVNVTLFRRYAERWLKENEAVNSDMMILVRQAEATQSGLAVEFIFFLKNKVAVQYEHDISTIMEYIIAITPDFGLKIYQKTTI
ncbi:mechanosensitive ion channel family protein [Prevotella sp. OH937_COT-195]|uniref:mechanosensitive ion channel family protein n=1 Tax=Prevotella sp. OH937_COT-195 TaxID=2491051 RepID=UPI000F64CE8E|nr:mechanosensitive ion channel domain-containing protein [Prevotella sp. OH937_COT-195]RRD02208.1 mechanosensitive ion channel protein [Prevotella sp. OH937_COT-195]